MITREQVKDIATIIFLFDTNNLLDFTDFLDSLSRTGRRESPERHLFVITRGVLREIDGLKRSEGASGFQAREFSRQLERFIQSHPRNALGACSGDHTVFIDQETELTLGLDLRQLDPDEILLHVARRYQEAFGDIVGVNLCTADRNLSILAQQAGIAVVNFLDWAVLEPRVLFHANLARAMRFNLFEEVSRSFAVPGVLGLAETGVVAIWPGWGYAGGEVSEYHLLYAEGDYRSSTLVLAAGPVWVPPVQPGAFIVADFRFADRDHPCAGILPLPDRQMVYVVSNRCATRSVPNGESAREQRFFTEFKLRIEVTALPSHVHLTVVDPEAVAAATEAPAGLQPAAP